MTPTESLDRKVIVVDADVARACNPDRSPATVSGRCARVLLSILRICHRLAVTEAGKREWADHQSLFFSTWRTEMESREKCDECPDALPAALTDRIVGAVTTGRAEWRVRKDLHLLGAALASDRIVVSCEDKARRDFAGAAASVGQIADVHWVNPRLGDLTEIVSWLEEGAPPRDEWKLGYRPDE
jgi:hypothetical protein